ncbi:MAG: DNA polymerase III subunit gamma/tau [Patescibacteria group bacterium]
MALAFHRKYRPKKLSELVGQEENIRILQNAAKEDKLGQAYLFYGSRGTGKTTTARLVAKLLNCEKRNTDDKFRKLGEPCGECSSCLEIDNASAIDLIEIDAASNRGIDEMRNLKENIRVAPTSSRYKVYIIDEAHMLTREAANALLKTLEEPPQHTTIILATTEYEKLPPTITSRTQRFLFKKLPKPRIIEKLKRIVEEEAIAIEPEALELIAVLGEGSLRDAESVLDQMSSFSSVMKDKKKDVVTLALVEELTGRVGTKKIYELSKLVLENDKEGVAQYLEKMNEEGHDLTRFTKDFIHYLRKVITLKASPRLEEDFQSEMTDEEIKKLKTLSAHAVPEKHIPLLRNLIRAYADMRYSPFALIPLQITLLEFLENEPPRA